MPRSGKLSDQVSILARPHRPSAPPHAELIGAGVDVSILARPHRPSARQLALVGDATLIVSILPRPHRPSARFVANRWDNDGNSFNPRPASSAERPSLKGCSW